MASKRQEQRDAAARAQGYQSYYDYRNAMARGMGYGNYGEQRTARQTGVGLKGQDLKTRESIFDKITKQLPPVVPDTPINQQKKTTVKTGLPPVQEKPPYLFRYERERVDKVPTELKGPAATGPLGDLLRKFSGTQNDIMGIINKFGKQAQEHGTTEGEVLDEAKKVNQLLQETDKFATDFIKSALPNYFLAGAVAGGKAALTDHDKNKIRDIQKEALGNMKRANLGTIRSTAGTLTSLDKTTFPTKKEVAGIIDRGGARAIVYKDGTRRSYGDFTSASMHALSSRAYNTAYLDAAVKNGATKFIISDGGGCGFTEHDDPNEANGMVVDYEAANQYPIAHPHCVRQYEVYNGPREPEKKGKDGLYGEALALLGKGLKDIAVASLAATAQATLSTFVKQQGLDIVARDVLHEAVEPALQTFMDRFRKVSFPDVIDFQTGLPKIFTQAEIVQDALSYAEDFATLDPEESAVPFGVIPEYLQTVLTGTDGPAHAVDLGRAMDSFTSMADKTIRPGLNVVNDFFGKVASEGLTDTLFDAWAGVTSGAYSPDNFLRMSFPGITRAVSTTKDMGVRFDLTNLKVLQGNITKTLKGERGNLAISPNSLIRAGIHVDSLKGGLLQSLTPTLRFKLFGPIRIQTTLNRATTDIYRKEGVITPIKFKPHARTIRDVQPDIKEGHLVAPAGRVLSLSTRISFVTPRHLLRDVLPDTFDNTIISKAIDAAGIDLSASARFDLRRLGLKKLSDIKDLRWPDIQNLIEANKDDIDPLTGWHLGQSIFRMVDITSKFHLYGGNFFDFVNTLRMKYENYDDQNVAQILWRLGRIELESSGIALPNAPFPFKRQIVSNTKILRESPAAKARRLAAEAKARGEPVPRQHLRLYKDQYRSKARTKYSDMSPEINE